MPNNEQKRVSIFNNEEQKQAYLKAKAEDDLKMKTDPEYRKRWEKLLETYNRLMPNHDTE